MTDTKIEKLTPEQEALIPVYLERFREYGTQTGEVNQDECKKAIDAFYKWLKMDQPKKYYYTDSLEQGIAKVKTLIDEDVSQFELISSCNWGNIYAYWGCFYQFINEELPVERVEGIEFMESLFKYCPPFWMLDDAVVVARFPDELHFNDNNELHNPHGPSVLYPDGMALYTLNGIKVPDWVITTPKEDLDPTKILAIDNVEIRLAAMKHMGLEHFLDKINYKKIDEETVDGCNYQLLLIDIEGKDCEFLRMDNPSTDEVHIEGEPPGTKTVKEARARRLGIKEEYLNNIAFQA